MLARTVLGKTSRCSGRWTKASNTLQRGLASSDTPSVGPQLWGSKTFFKKSWMRETHSGPSRAELMRMQREQLYKSRNKNVLLYTTAVVSSCFPSPIINIRVYRFLQL